MSRLSSTFRLSPVLVFSAGLYASAASASLLPPEASLQSANKEIAPFTRPDKSTALFFDVTDRDESMQFAGLANGKDQKDTQVDWDKHDKGRGKGNHQDKDHDEDEDSDTELGDDATDTGVTEPSTGIPDPGAIPSAVPVPAALWLLLSGSFGLGLSGVRRQRR